eukprot:gb/GECG01016173.1/.p1 GENE.gb/GECG01016173.1/~~gb/GECG01016173.1/.p1  ORF type:complete len:2237 (+),score=187.50 gb/GECG01016173.1/:1-6711(+)
MVSGGGTVPLKSPSRGTRFTRKQAPVRRTIFFWSLMALCLALWAFFTTMLAQVSARSVLLRSEEYDEWRIPVFCDVDGDSLPDVVYRSDDTGDILWNRNVGFRGPPQFDPEKILTVLQNDNDGTINHLACGDLNGDGHIDVVFGVGVEGVYQHRLEWLQNDGEKSPAFGKPTLISTQLTIGGADANKPLLLSDVTGDEYLDVLAGSTWGPLHILYNDGVNTSFTAMTTVDVGVYDMEVGDIDLDGDVDITVVAYKNGIKLLENQGQNLTHSPSFKLHQPPNLHEEFRAVAVVVKDMNSDRNPDIVVNDFGEAGVWFMELSNFTILTASLLPLSIDNFPRGPLHVWDVNNDGFLDIVSSRIYPKKTYWLKNDGRWPPSFTNQFITPLTPFSLGPPGEVISVNVYEHCHTMIKFQWESTEAAGFSYLVNYKPATEVRRGAVLPYYYVEANRAMPVESGAFRNVTVDYLDLVLDDAAYIGRFSFCEAHASSGKISGSVDRLEGFAFSNSKLMGVAMDISNSTLTGLGKKVFLSTSISTINFSWCMNLVMVNDSAFEGSDVNTISLQGSSVEILGDAVFRRASVQSLIASDTLKLTEIPMKAFANSKINKLILDQSGIRSIRQNAFKEAKLAQLKMRWTSSLRSIREAAFKDSTVDDLQLKGTGLQAIGNNAYQGATLKRLDLTEATNITDIGDAAFMESNIYELLVDHTGLSEVGRRAFWGAVVTLLSMSHTANMNTIAEGVFEESSVGELVLIGSNIQTIQQDSFKGSNIKELSMSRTFRLDDIMEGAFVEAQVDKLLLSKSGIRRVGRGSFNRSRISYLNMRHTFNLQSIAELAFEGASIDELTLDRSNIEEIGPKAFRQAQIKTIVISGTVNLTTIFEGAFWGARIDKLYLNESGIRNIGRGAFNRSRILHLNMSHTFNLRSVAELAFEGASIDELTLDRSSVDEIGKLAFQQAHVKQLVMSPTINLTNILKWTFLEASIDNLLLNETGVQYISREAFYGAAIQHVNMSHTLFLREIAERAFADSNIGELSLENSNIWRLKRDVFSGASLDRVEMSHTSTLVDISTAFGNSSLNGLFFNRSGLNVIYKNSFKGTKIKGTISFVGSALREIAGQSFRLASINVFVLDNTPITSTSGNQFSHGSVSFLGVRNSTLERLQERAFEHSTIKTLDVSNSLHLHTIEGHPFHNAVVDNFILDHSGSFVVHGGALSNTSMKYLSAQDSDIQLFEDKCCQHTSLDTIDMSNTHGLRTIGTGAFTRSTFGDVIFKGSKVRKLNRSSFEGATVSGTITFERSTLSIILERAFRDALIEKADIGRTHHLSSIEPNAFKAAQISRFQSCDSGPMVLDTFSFAEASIDNFYLDRSKLKAIRPYAFRNASFGNFQASSLQHVEGINRAAFEHAKLGDNMNWAKSDVNAISEGAFSYLRGPQAICSLSLASSPTMGSLIFEGSVLQSVKILSSELDTISEGMFQGATIDLLDIDNTKLKSIESNAFRDASINQLQLTNALRLQFVNKTAWDQLGLANVDFSKTDMVQSGRCLPRNRYCYVEVRSDSGLPLPTCQQLSVGEYCPGNGNPISLCPAGHYCFFTDPTGEPVPCSVGTFNDLEGQQSSGSCLKCPTGRYSSQKGVTSVSCSMCDRGTFSNTEGAKSITECQACPAGKYAGLGSTSCSNCPPGRFSTTVAAHELSTCEKCPLGTFSEQLGAANVSACTACPSGRTTSSVGSSSEASCTAIPKSCTSDTQEIVKGACMCPKSTHWNGGECVNCEEGKYSPGHNMQPECLECPPGRYVSTQGATGCYVCPAGTMSQNWGSVSCDECSDEFLCPVGSSTELTEKALADLEVDVTLTNTTGGSGEGDSQINEGANADRSSNSQSGSVEQAGNQVLFISFGSLLLVLGFAAALAYFLYPGCLDLLRQVDIFSEDHYREDLETMRKEKTSLGGFVTVIFVIVTLGLVAQDLSSFINHNQFESETTEFLREANRPVGSELVSLEIKGISTHWKHLGKKLLCDDSQLTVPKNWKAQASRDKGSFSCTWFTECKLQPCILPSKFRILLHATTAYQVFSWTYQVKDARGKIDTIGDTTDLASKEGGLQSGQEYNTEFIATLREGLSRRTTGYRGHIVSDAEIGPIRETTGLNDTVSIVWRNQVGSLMDVTVVRRRRTVFELLSSLLGLAAGLIGGFRVALKGIEQGKGLFRGKQKHKPWQQAYPYKSSNDSHTHTYVEDSPKCAETFTHNPLHRSR